METDITEKIKPIIRYSLPIILIIAALLVFGIFKWNEAKTVLNISDAKLTSSLVHVSAQSDGTLTEILVNDGDKVEAGQVIAKVKVITTPEQIEALQKACDEAQANFDNIEQQIKSSTTTTQTVVSSAPSSGNIAAAQARVDAAAAQAEKMSKLYSIGAGKTTTIGKLAKRFKDEGKSVILAAADTFRAGAVEQLEEWGKRVGVPVVTGKEKADPASVVYDATERAIKEQADYLLVDTAGRLQNKKNLMAELEKIQRTIKKLLPDQPTETLLVLDGSTGQNALLQAKDFDKTTKLTGLVLTKLDGSSKGGVVLAIRHEMKLPVKLVGLGEKAEDLADFDAANYAIGLFHGLV